MRKFPKDVKPPDTTDFKLIRTKKFTPAQQTMPATPATPKRCRSPQATGRRNAFSTTSTW